MHPDQLFIKTLDDINRTIDTGDEYEILRSTALLRQMLLDGRRLVDEVNRKYRMKIKYLVADGWKTPYAKRVMEMNPSFFAILDGLYPGDALLQKPVRTLKRDEFLGYRVCYSEGSYLTVSDLVSHCANVLGGVHVGKARTQEEERLSALQDFRFGGAPYNLRQIMPLLKIVRDALDPLRERIDLRLDM